jgi:hypothetical protein
MAATQRSEWVDGPGLGIARVMAPPKAIYA